MIRYHIHEGKRAREYGFDRLPTQEDGGYDYLVKLIKNNERCVLKLTDITPKDLPVKELMDNIRRRVEDSNTNLGTFTLSAQLVDVPHRPKHMYVLFWKTAPDTNQEALSLLSEGDGF